MQKQTRVNSAEFTDNLKFTVCQIPTVLSLLFESRVYNAPCTVNPYITMLRALTIGTLQCGVYWQSSVNNIACTDNSDLEYGFY